jgi:hypothetical protein
VKASSPRLSRPSSPRPSRLFRKSKLKNQNSKPSPTSTKTAPRSPPGDQVLLIVEDDEAFAGVLRDRARERGFKCVVALTAEKALQFARDYSPAAITLDLRLPDGDGWALLDRWKHDPATRHVPVHVISVEEQEERGLRLGAMGYLRKPVTKEAIDAALDQTKAFIERRVRSLLVVEDNEADRMAIVELIGNGDVQITSVGTAEEALAALEKQRFDCAVVDLKLPGLSGFELIHRIKKLPAYATLPIIIYTARELTKKVETELRKLSEAIVIKGVRSPERLLDETALFLHPVQARLPEPKRKMIERVWQSDPLLAGKKVLVVDDDVRNIFAMTTALEHHKMQVLYAESGQQALDLLGKTPDVDLVLMDVMMPEMDGWECMQRIRALPKFKKLPILAVTAKAMKGDREKCLEAGANDYITKPVDMDQLRSLLRVWLYK